MLERRRIYNQREVFANFITSDGHIIKTADGHYFNVQEMPTENDYIQNGLIFQLDGINKGNDDGYWTDLKSNLKFLLQNCVAEKNCVTFNGSGVIQASSNISMPQASCTIEFVCDPVNKSSAILFPSAKGNIMAVFSGSVVDANTLIFNVGSNTANRFKVPTNTKIVSCTVSSCIVNGVESTTYGTDSWSAQINGNIKIGGRGTDYLYSGKIYAIRIYNRQLTTEEMLYNLNLDRLRFVVLPK